MRQALAFVAVLALPSAPVLGQSLPDPMRVQCYDVGPAQGAGLTKTYLDMAQTQSFRIDAAQQDAAVMAGFTGVWYGEFTTPQMNSTTRIYYSFEPNGLFQYRSQSCWGFGCSDGYGTGQWVGLRQDDGRIRVIYNWSDLERTSACGGATGILDGDTFRSDIGDVWKRVQRFDPAPLPVDPGLAPPPPGPGGLLAPPVLPHQP